MRKRDYRAEDAARGNRHARGYGVAWEAIRAQVVREEPLCRGCYGRGKISPTSQVDHIKPKADGGTDDRENLQGLCSDCHAAKTAQEQGAPPRGGCDAKGLPLDPLHPWNRGG